MFRNSHYLPIQKKATDRVLSKPENLNFPKKCILNLLSAAKISGFKTEEGEFGENMQVSLVNDGPVTIIMDSTQR